MLYTEKNSFAEILIVTRIHNKKIDVPNKQIIISMDKAFANWKPDTILKIRDWNRLMNDLPLITVFKEEEGMTIEQML